MGGIEVVAPSYDARDGSAGNGRAGNGQAGNGWVGDESDVIDGMPVSAEDRTESDHAGAAAPPVADRTHVPPGLLENMRKQVADFADFAHRTRITPNSADPLQALGYGGGITAAVVDTIADIIYGTEPVAGLTADKRALTDELLLALVAPADPDQLTERQLESFVSWRGRLALDVSMAEIGAEPEIRLVHLDDHPERQLRAGDGDGGGDGDGNRVAGRDFAGPCAAVIVGSAAYIAEERPYLSLDRLMAHARSKVYRSAGPAAAPATPGAGLRAARSLEIVVLLDTWLGGGLWIDIDRATGRVAAALAIGLSPTGIQFTHVHRLSAPNLRAQPAAIASA